MVAPILKINISHNTKCDNLVSFPKSGHNSSGKECDTVRFDFV